MSPTVHKDLLHVTTVMKHAILPIGQLLDLASEARSKHFRQYRQMFSQNFSRAQCNKDVLNIFLLNSDPLISNLRPKPK